MNNNHLYKYKFNVPLKAKRPTQLTCNSDSAHILLVNRNNILVSCVGKIICVDAATKKIKWEYEEDETSAIGGICDETDLYLTLNDSRVASVEFDSGKELWDLPESQGTWSLSQKNLYLIRFDGEKALVCVDRKTKRIKWQFTEMLGYRGYVRILDDYVLVQGSEGYSCLLEEMGEKIWTLSTMEMLQERFGERIKAWKARPGGGGNLAPKIPFNHLGCLGTGLAYISWDIGVVAAIELKTGSFLWSWEFPKGRDFNVANTMILRNDFLYFHDNQHRGMESYLYCLNAKTGELVFMSEERITPAGCSNAVMIGKYFIGGSRNHLSVWDVELQEKVWSYQHKKGEIFRGPPGVYDGGIVFADSENDCLHWFECEGG